MKRTEIQEIGEFGLIDRLAAQAPRMHASTIQGIGDDAAVLHTGGPEYLVMTTDMLLEGIHFDLAFTPLKHLGYKAIAVNLSDVAAMNALPTQVTVSIGLSNRFSVEAVEELYAGIYAACTHYQVELVGGDTTSSRSGLVISVTALGYARPEQISYRHTARKGDILCVTGDLGAAYLGLQILAREKQAYLANPDMQPDLSEANYLIGRQLKPEARIDIIHELRALSIVPTAMIDISDGLASEVLHLCKRSSLGAVLYEEHLPVEQASYQAATEQFHLSPTTCALNGGEDYELLFTIRQEDYEKIKNHPDISFIGYMHESAKGAYLVTRAGQQVNLQAQGWKHF